MTSPTAIDPVCGMTVDTSTPLRAERHGTTYYFCNPGCRAKFVANPDQYLDKARAPATVTVDAGPNPELVDMLRRLAVAVGFGAPVMAYAMWTMVRPLPDAAHSLANWLQLAAATPVVCYAGAPFFARAWDSLV